jgi:hypothetical protein
MPLFGYYYPDHLTFASADFKWEPTIGPVVGSSGEENDGVIADIMADGVTQWVDIDTPPTDIIEYEFDNLTELDRSKWRTFRDNTLGLIFEVYDTISESYIFVQFAHDGFNRVWDVQHEFGERLAVKHRLRKI